MNIKKVSNSIVMVEGDIANAEINTENPANILIKTKSATKEMSFDRPGEYEFGNMGIEAYEVAKENYQAQINFVKLTLGHVDLFYLTSDVEVSKDEVSSTAEGSILMISNISIKYLKEMINKVDPFFVIIVDNKNDSTAALISDIKNEFGYEKIESDSKFKFNDKDFEMDENQTVQFKILE